MQPILQGLAQMTGQRSHARLERSVITTLARLEGVVSVGMMDLVRLSEADYVLFKHGDGAFCRVCETGCGAEIAGLRPLAEYPELGRAIAHGKRQASAILSTADGDVHVTWLIFWHRQQALQCVELRQNRPFTAERLELIAAVFQVYQNYHDLLDDSERDALTGLYNRKTFDELRFRRASDIPHTPQGQAALQRRRGQGDHPEFSHGAGTPGQPDADESDWLAVIDIDNFKQINDRFGHLYGDEVLLLVANLLKQGFRSTDRVFRYGGEEFVVLLRAADLATTEHVLERLRQAIAAHRFPQVGQVTVSIGFSRAGDATLSTLIEQADRALYYVKRNGKNQLAHYESLLERGLVQAPVQNQEVDLF
ncbi:hypothetical protein AAV94_04460 [Lampropedia cohaerens]|uniref:diguanylate cyclase n=1 Tax=Lampropedia cohaerens TaxID=1610491 RepID=A0A0U1Q1J9_9BURK|nr:hypothetical protein AAV94_04460 [Lampropedia cohaerens]